MILVNDPRAVAVADLDFDGRNDLVVASGDLEQVLVYLFNPTTNTFELANAVAVPFRPALVDVESGCSIGTPIVLVQDEAQSEIVAVLDVVGDSVVEVVDEHYVPICTRAAAANCDDDYVTSVEGECSRTPIDGGIAACFEAVDCRLGDCKWAACVLWAAGDYNFFRYAGARLACAAVFDVELVGCVPRHILR